MIRREIYMKRVRPLIGTELIKVMTGIHRCGKSVILELIKAELADSGVSPAQMIPINSEDICWHPLKPRSVSLACMTASATTTRSMLYLWTSLT